MRYHSWEDIQVYEQGDTLCCVACGLGGGSLVNAAVLTATPVRARRNPRWPEEWNNDWESCQATASAMLGSNSIPSEFSSAKVMKQVAEEEIENFRADKIELGINFGQELKHQTKGGQEIGSCVACGNCLSGCPYNAKNSNDKTYITSAIQALTSTLIFIHFKYIALITAFLFHSSLGWMCS